MDSEQACFAVDRGDLELAVVTLPQQPTETLRTELLWADPLDIVVGADHPLASRGSVEATELASHAAILPAATTFTRRIVAAALRPRVAQLRVAMETNYLETIRMMVSVGLGWSALPRSLNEGELVALAVPGVALRRDLGLVQRLGRTLGNAAGAFVTVARDHADADVA